MRTSTSQIAGIQTPQQAFSTSHWHCWISLLLSIALIPLLRQLNLPIRFDWTSLLSAYWLVLTAQSIFVASLLWLVVAGRTQREPVVVRYRRNPLNILFALLYFVALGWALSWTKALILTVDTFAILEFHNQNPQRLRKAAIALLSPALYLFAGFLLVFSYNDIIASVHFGFASDTMFQAVDKWMLHGGSVSALSHWALRTFPLSFFHFLEFIYFGMFPQIGAAIILVTLYDGKYRSLQFVGTILIAYYLALGLFCLWPSQGPYYLCWEHFSRFPASLQAFAIQKTLIARALALWNHVPIRSISTDYFIAFPCMHIAQPLIVIWFLRRWKRLVIILCAYDSLLIVSILLLEWHYVIDIIAGVLVAGIAILLTRNSDDERSMLQKCN